MRGVKQTVKTLKEIWGRKEQRKFLLSYLIYEDGVNTVIVFSSIFAATTLGFKPQELIALYLIVQVSAFIGATAMAKPIDTWGPKRVVTLSLFMWTSVSIVAFFIPTKVQFWLLASFAGLGLGTVQAASRAFYTQFIPKEKEAEYFGVYSLVGKSSAIAGPLVFGQVSSAFGFFSDKSHEGMQGSQRWLEYGKPAPSALLLSLLVLKVAFSHLEVPVTEFSQIN